MNELDEQVIAEFRANDGMVNEALGGHFRGVNLLVLHHVGRRSGRAYTNPLMYVRIGDDLILTGSNGGATDEPQWVANVEAMREVVVETAGRFIRTTPTVLRAGAERDRLYETVVGYWSDMLMYETHTSRSFPVIRLTPTAAGDEPRGSES